MNRLAHILRLGLKELTSLRHDSVLLLFLFYAFTVAIYLPAAGSVSNRLTCALTSCSVMRPLVPVPCTFARSTPSSRAKRRIDGLACERENPGSPTTIPAAPLPASSLAGAGDGWMTG